MRAIPFAPKWLLAALAGLLLAAMISLALEVHLHSAKLGMPYRDSFASGTADEWQAFGGTWGINDGGMRNDSDERGAKLISGSPYWRNYLLEADVKLLGPDGDAGMVVRSSDEELGVDSYSGYYAGLRTRDNRLVLGRANHGWTDARALPIQGGVQAFQWYHLKILAYECHIAASAAFPLLSGNTTTVEMTEQDCAKNGRVGLRSYSSGGAWRNVQVRPASEEDFVAFVGNSTGADAAQNAAPEAEFFGSGSLPAHMDTQHGPPGSGVQSIASVRLIPESQTVATVRGVVILTTPVLYIQDSTGGAAVVPSAAQPLKVGDEVQVSGKAEALDFSSILRDANVQLLWARTPMPPISVTASQAATGSFDAMFVEVVGHLRGKQRGQGDTLILDLEDGQQSFRVIVNQGRGELLFRKLKPHSLLRLRGVCVVSPTYTANLTPFVLLLRSMDDVEVLVGPPWWNPLHVVVIGCALLILTFIGYFIYSRIEQWTLRGILEERERLAHEMHDTLAQSFAGLGFQLQAIRNRMPGDFPAVDQQLDLACDLVRHSHEEARRSIAALRPQSLEPFDLVSALERSAKHLVEGGDVVVDVFQLGDPRPIPMRITDTLFRIGQEALANSVRHAQPTRIGLSIDYAQDEVRLAIEDNGVGFTSGRESGGFGLRGMRRRAAAISAKFQIISSPGAGTRILVIAHLPPRLTLNAWPRYIWSRLWEYPFDAKPREETYQHSYRR